MTNPAFKLLAPKNNATTSTLLGAIGASDTAIVLNSGHGAALPSILRGDCSSTGDARTLNDTGALASVAVGDYIYNLTDGSWAVVITGGTNSIRTTPLEGGSLNVWTSGDIWVVGMFVATITQLSGSTIVKQERILVTNRVTDALTAVRGFDGDTALSFLSGDSVQILVEEAQIEGVHNAIRNILGKLDAIHRGVPFYNVTTGSANAYAVTLTPKVTDYADIVGLPIILKANFANTSAATLNVNGLGAKNIKKEGGATALASGDIAVDMMVVVIYNGTLFVMVNAPANAAASGDLAMSDKTADYTIVSGDSSNIVTSNGAAYPLVFTLVASPIAAKRYHILPVSDGILIKQNASEKIRMPDGNNVTSIFSFALGAGMLELVVETNSDYGMTAGGIAWAVAKGYVAGGNNAPNSGGSYQTAVEDLDFVAETSAAIARMAIGTGRAGRPGSCANTRWGAIGGGYTGANSSVIDRFLFIPEVRLSAAATLDNARTGMASGSTPWGIGYFIGGDIGGTNSNRISRVQIEADLEVEATLTLSTTRRNSYGLSVRGSIFSLGGQSGGSNVNSGEKITVPTETTTAVTDTLGTAKANGAGCSGGSRGVLLGGNGSGTTDDDVEVFIYATEVSTVKAAVLASTRMGCAGLGGVKGYCAGGENVAQDTGRSSFESFNYNTEAIAAVSGALDATHVDASGLQAMPI